MNSSSKKRLPLLPVFTWALLASVLTPYGDEAAPRQLPNQRGASLHGTVVDSLTSLPLAGALVVVSESPVSGRLAHTDSVGGYRFTWAESLPEGKVQFSFFEYRSKNFAVPGDASMTEAGEYRLDAMLVRGP